MRSPAALHHYILLITPVLPSPVHQHVILISSQHPHLMTLSSVQFRTSMHCCLGSMANRSAPFNATAHGSSHLLLWPMMHVRYSPESDAYEHVAALPLPEW